MPSSSDIERELRNIGESFSDTFNALVLREANQVLDEIRTSPNMPYKTGRLARSLQARLVDAQFLGITMEDYGYYQNFGVLPIKGPNNISPNEVDEYPFGLNIELSSDITPVGKKYQFGTGRAATNTPPTYYGIHYVGIKAKRFIDFEDYVEEVVRRVNQNLEL